MKHVILATCADLPQLDPDDRVLREALEGRGARVRPAIWDDPAQDWSADLCLIRSTWDYHRKPEAFRIWARAVAATTRLVNPLDVVLWNSHKFYLRDLHERGVPVVPSEWLDRGTAFDFEEILERRGWDDVVIKPAHGASSHGVVHVKAQSGRDAGSRALAGVLEEEDAIVQPFLKNIAAYHERALVFIDGKYSHAVTKEPFMHATAHHGDRAAMPPGASGEVPVDATADEIALATQALHASPTGHLYARIDIVRDDDFNPRILELELIEPTLYFYARQAAAIAFAELLLRL